MGLDFFSSRSGLESCSREGRMLHSSRDPLREARSFLRARALEGLAAPAAQVILLGPCLDYLGEALREERPGLDILSIQFSPEFRGREREGARLRWYPEGGQGIEAFLLSALDADALAPLLLLEWPPAAEAFPQAAREAREAVARALRRRASEAATARGMGRLWIRNSLRNFLGAEELVELAFEDEPLVILGAGPSLGPALDLIAPHRGGLRLIAVASALGACLARGLSPDLVVSSDPGRWNLFHLAGLRGRNLPLASPLSAAPGPSSGPLLLLDQGWLFESALARALGGGLALPSHGTVSGSALALAARLGRGTLLLAGLDFAASPAETHVRPHAFEALILRGESRLSPAEGLRWERLVSGHPQALGSSGWRSSRSLEIYAGAIAEDGMALDGRLFRLLPSPVELPGIPELDPAALGELAREPLGPPRLIPRGGLPSRGERVAFLRSLLGTWGEEAAAFLGREEAGLRKGEAIVELLRCIDLPDWAALRRAALGGLDGGKAAAALLAETRAFLSDLEGRLLG